MKKAIVKTIVTLVIVAALLSGVSWLESTVTVFVAATLIVAITIIALVAWVVSSTMKTKVLLAAQRKLPGIGIETAVIQPAMVVFYFLTGHEVLGFGLALIVVLWGVALLVLSHRLSKIEINPFLYIKVD